MAYRVLAQKTRHGLMQLSVLLTARVKNADSVIKYSGQSHHSSRPSLLFQDRGKIGSGQGREGVGISKPIIRIEEAGARGSRM